MTNYIQSQNIVSQILKGGAGGNSPQHQPPMNASVCGRCKHFSMLLSLLTTACSIISITRGNLPCPVGCLPFLQPRKEDSNLLPAWAHQFREILGREARAQRHIFFCFWTDTPGRELNKRGPASQSPPSDILTECAEKETLRSTGESTLILLSPSPLDSNDVNSG